MLHYDAAAFFISQIISHKHRSLFFHSRLQRSEERIFKYEKEYTSLRAEKLEFDYSRVVTFSGVSGGRATTDADGRSAGTATKKSSLTCSKTPCLVTK